VRRIVRSAGLFGLRYCPNCGGVGCVSCWVFITPWCGMGFCSTAGGVVARIVVGPAEGQAVLEDVVDCLSLSAI
jgi:hypothetical protein